MTAATVSLGLALCLLCLPHPRQASAEASSGTAASAKDGGRGTPEEAKALLDRGAAHAAKVGFDQAKKDFADLSGPFIDRDLYIFCIGADGRVASHPRIPALVGLNEITLRDSNGKKFGLELVTKTRAEGSASVEYTWPHPVSRKFEPKVTFGRLIGDEVCAAGAYLRR